MDAPETLSDVGEPSQALSGRIVARACPLAPRPRPPHLGALYASPTGPTVLVYYPEHHSLGLPLVRKELEAADEPDPDPIIEALEPLEFEILYRTDGGSVIQATVRLDPASLPAPPGDWVVWPTGDWRHQAIPRFLQSHPLVVPKSAVDFDEGPLVGLEPG
jgi:hypothetical protein